MNPPSALYGAMNKDRKPFTYTPGGLDLSEIKSERMAQRLMRNAMSQGVPEVPVQTIHSPPVQLSSGAIPNFNCLPVQVFPTFPLPPNPKSLLRTRSNPDPTKDSLQTTTPSSSVFHCDDISNVEAWKPLSIPSTCDSENNSSNNNKSGLLNDYKTDLKNQYPFESTSVESDDHTKYFLPEKSFEAEYFLLEPEGNIRPMGNKSSNVEEISPSSTSILYPYMKIGKESNPVILTSPASQDKTTNNFEQKEVKIVKKQTKTEKKEDQNGDAEAALIVKLPSKKSSAKTETNVEVLKKILPDGTVEEVKTTTTKTTIDGKTEIKTETETLTIPPPVAEEVIEVEEEEEEEEIESDVVENNETERNQKEDIEEFESVVKDSPDNAEQESEEVEEEYKVDAKNAEVKENGLITSEGKIETSNVKTIVQSTEHDSGEEEEEEEIVEEEVAEEEDEEDGDVNVEQVVILKKHADIESKSDIIQESDDIVETVAEEQNFGDKLEVEEEDNENIQEDQERDNILVNKKEVEEVEQNEVNDVEDEEEIENEGPENENAEIIYKEKDTKEEDAEEEYEEAEDINSTGEEVTEDVVEKCDLLKGKNAEKLEEISESDKKETPAQESLKTSGVITEEPNTLQSKEEHIHKIILESEPKVSFREPSIPLEKVEDVEIKPIAPAQEVIKKCHTEIITTTKDEPTGALSTQTEYNRIENIVTVNRTTKTLDPAHEQSEHSIPNVKTFFVPPNDRILSTPQPISRPYQPVYTPEPQTERRHSLLLDRLSVERQIPVQQTDIYQNNYNSQGYEQNPWLQEPQSEVVTVSNVKPSTITKNQQWYQQTKTETTSNIVTPTPIMPSQLWSQTQSQAQSQPQPQLQPQYQSFVQPQGIPKTDCQPPYTEKSNQSSFKGTNIQQNVYPSYTPKPSWVSSTFDTKPTPVTQTNQYSTLQRDSIESSQKSTQQFSSSYVPPPWEQDSNYVAENQNYYQPPPTIVYTPSQTWNPKPTSKFSKPTPTSYIPPAPNQSFVKPVTNVDPPKLPGRKTYYSEYERRYISVPESTYIPNESKYQAQPDPSPQYYFDNNEPAEVVEPQWRKELREFTEKTSQTTIQTEKTSVKPPWEEDSKYALPGYTTTATPTWTQTLRPRSWRERSFEPDHIGSKEWPRTNTLGRGRPQSSYVKTNIETIQERPRGVSVDRYNPNNYQSPPSSEHPPVQSYTLNPNVYPKTYHNPNVPAYHSRASAEPKEHQSPYAQPRSRVETRVPPVQSRSFKYLQWITGTED